MNSESNDNKYCYKYKRIYTLKKKEADIMNSQQNMNMTCSVEMRKHLTKSN